MPRKSKKPMTLQGQFLVVFSPNGSERTEIFLEKGAAAEAVLAFGWDASMYELGAPLPAAQIKDAVVAHNQKKVKKEIENTKKHLEHLERLQAKIS